MTDASTAGAPNAAGSLEGQVIVVAGGAGEVGEGVVRVLLHQGATVIAPSRSPEKIAHLERAAGGHAARLHAPELDVGSARGQERLASLVHEVGRLDAVVSSIGGFWAGPAIAEVDAAVFREKLEERVFPHLALIQRLGRQLPGGSGAFIHLSGLVALFGMPGLSALSVSAAAQLALTQAFRAESGEAGPRIYGVVIEQFVLTRSRQDLPPGSLTADEVGQVVADLIAGRGPRGMIALRKVEGKVEVEALPPPISPASVARLSQALGG